MGKLFLMFLTVTGSFSVQVFATGLDLVGGKYGSYSFTCGYDVEKSGTQIILTAISNTMIEYPGCRDMGMVSVFDCEPKSNLCSANLNLSDKAIIAHNIMILDDGNFLELNPAQLNAKFIKTQ